jgi:hypothetical protein
MENLALMFYGNGSDLGNFKVFAGGLKQSLRGSYAPQHVIDLRIIWRADFFDSLANPPFENKIGELHIFAHSTGGGLFLGYHLEERRQARDFLIANSNHRLTYEEVLNAEETTVFTDDFVRHPWVDMRDDIRDNFAPGALIKIWGCNSGLEAHEYSDGDPFDPRTPYYWRAINEQRTPKPSVAQAVADYFGLPTYGATSGSHVEVFSDGHWTKTNRYRATVGHWPSARLEHRLKPDRGDYQEFLPQGP